MTSIVDLAELVQTHQCTVDEFAVSVMAEGVWPGVPHCCGDACSGLVRGFNSYIGPAVLHPPIHVEDKTHVYLRLFLLGQAWSVRKYTGILRNDRRDPLDRSSHVCALTDKPHLYRNNSAQQAGCAANVTTSLPIRECCKRHAQVYAQLSGVGVMILCCT